MKTNVIEKYQIVQMLTNRFRIEQKKLESVKYVGHIPMPLIASWNIHGFIFSKTNEIKYTMKCMHLKNPLEEHHIVMLQETHFESSYFDRSSLHKVFPY